MKNDKKNTESIFNCDESELIGRIPIRSEITGLPVDKSKNIIGWNFTEKVGIGIFNPRGIKNMGILNTEYRIYF